MLLWPDPHSLFSFFIPIPNIRLEHNEHMNLGSYCYAPKNRRHGILELSDDQCH